MKCGNLTELELLLVLAVLRRGNNAYGLMIQDELKSSIGHEVTLGTIYNTMERLEGKGLVTSKIGDESADRLGRPRRYFTIEGSGFAAVAATREDLRTMFDGLEPLLGMG